MNELEQLQKAIEMLEAQRAVLGDAVVDAALAPLQNKLAALSQPTVGEQRKLLSILFADLVDFTPMSEQMDPEDVREILQAYFSRWEACIEAHGGVIEKFIGDAVMAVFGLHTAREDDSERAVAAALAMREALEELNDHLEVERGLRLQMRVAVHTGQVVVSLLGERRGQDFVVVGDSVNTASRLQNAAPPHGVLVSHDTFRLVHGRFDVQALDPVQVKGKRDPLRVYLVVRAKARALNFERSRSETPLVGRDGEMAVLEDFLRRAIDGRRQHRVTVMADAGLGKTRLVEEFEYRMELLPLVIRYYKGRASPYLQTQPYALLRDLFSFRFQVQESDPPEAVLGKLQNELGDPQGAGWIAQLLGFLPAGGSGLPDAQQLHDRAQAALVHYFRATASERPLVIVLEDLQWADESSMEVISVLQRELDDQPVLWLVSGRPELLVSRPQWVEEQPYRTRLDLPPLTREDSRKLLALLLPQVGGSGNAGGGRVGARAARSGGSLPEAVETLITGSAEGNPFYLEELLRMLVEDGVIFFAGGGWQADAERLAAVRIPPTLTEFLQARLDSLPPDERALLQRAAVIGRVFWDQAVDFLHRQIHPSVQQREAGQPAMTAMLDHLRRHEVILQREQSSFEGTREYRFTHNLFRDVTYESLLKRQRRVYHAFAARWLEEVTERGRRAGEYAALIAEHYAQAEEDEPAARWYHKAGDLACARYANAEAVHAFTRALELLPAGELETRFDLLLAREKVYDRVGNREAQAGDITALERLAEGLGEARRAEALLRRAHLAFMSDDNPTAIELAQQAIPLAEESGQARLAVEGNLLWGRALLWNSEHDEANRRLETTLELARAGQMPDLEASCLWNLGTVACNTGDYPQAHRLLRQALRGYRQLGDQAGESVVLGQQGVAYFSQGDYPRAQESFEAALAIIRAMGHRTREATILNNLGALAHEQGNYSASLRLQTRALELYRASGDKYGMATTLTNLGDGLRDVGEYGRSRAHFEEALAVARETGDPFVEAPLYSSLSLLQSRTGELDAALETGRRAAQISDEAQAAFYGSTAHACLALAHHLSGELEPAREQYQVALELQQRLGMQANAFESRVALAVIAMQTGEADLARREAEALFPLLQENSLNGCDEPARVFLALYRLLKANDDPAAAEVLRCGRAMIEARAARIDDPAMRESYLTNVASNRELLAQA